jgi:D-aminopeptidase
MGHVAVLMAGALAAVHPVAAPVTVDVSLKNYLPAEVLAYLRAVERTDAHSVRFRARGVAEASDFLVFVLNYNPALEP